MPKYLVNIREDDPEAMTVLVGKAMDLPMRWEFSTAHRLDRGTLVSLASCQIYVMPKETRRWCKLSMPMIGNDYGELFKTLSELFKDWHD